MLFNSLIFLVLVTITFFIYYLKGVSKYQVPLLILSSFIFYAYNKPILLLLLLTSAAINLFTSYYVVYGNVHRRKLLATLGVSANLVILIFFKYSPLIARSFFNPGDPTGDFLLTIPLPLGISFYTFQGISLMIDVYQEKYADNKAIIPRSFSEHARRIIFFTSFFPELTSGPIVKSHDFLPQIKTKYFKDISWDFFIKNMILGYFLKMVIADNLKDFTMWMEYPYFQGQTTITLLIMMFGYSCQIFADFAGYSLIAISLAGLFGYELKINFNFPYISSTFKEFWKRWHISLSSFLMEYLYFPLGGNRKGKVRTYLNLMITMLLGGLWHGEAWSYLAWGGLHGGALAIERFYTDKTRDKAKVKPENSLVRNLKRAFIFLIVSYAWLFFKLPDFSHVMAYTKAVFTNISFTFDLKNCIFIFIYCLPVAGYHLFYLHQHKTYIQNIKKYEFAFYGLMLFLIFTNSGSPGTFIYFQF